MRWGSDLIQDLGPALRKIRKQPAFAFLTALVLALGSAGSITGFSVLYQMLLKPLPYPDAARLVFLHNWSPQSQVALAGVSGFDYAELRRHKELFEDAGVYYWNDLNLTGQGSARHVDVVNASASLFHVLGVRPQLGRTFSAQDDRAGAAGTAILSDGLWRSAFGAERNVTGRPIYLNGAPYTVIGVMPAGFSFPSPETQLWIPIALPESAFTLTGGRLEKWLHTVARLSRSVTSGQAQAGLGRISDDLASKFSAFYPKSAGWQFAMRPFREEETDSIRRWIYLACGAIFSVLLIACVNVSGLLLIRGTARTGEIAVRLAIGASSGRVVRQLLTETGILVIFGTLLGVLFAFGGVHFVNVYGPLKQLVRIEGATLTFCFLLGALGTLSVGLLPALVSVARERPLQADGRRTATGSTRWREAIVACQVAFAVVLVVLAFELSRSFVNLSYQPAGFNWHHVWSGAVDLPSRAYAADESWNTRFFEPLVERLRHLPGVEYASAGNAIPFNPGGAWTEELHFPDRARTHPLPEAQIGLAFPGYFEALEIPLLAGRTFTGSDRHGAPPVAVIDQELARRYFPGERAIGKFIGSGGGSTPARIVGIVGGVHNTDLAGAREPEIYFPALQERTESLYLVLRTKADQDLTGAVRAAVAALDPTVALYDVHSMDERLANSLRLRRFVALLLNSLAALGISLAIVGLYASLSHMVQLRRREIGIRLAVGASPKDVVRMILAHGRNAIVAGTAAGLISAAAATQAIRNQLFGVGLADPQT